MKSLRRALWLLLAIGLMVVAWGFWGRVGNAALPVDTAVLAYENHGADAGRGNLLGIQPWVVPADYANAATLEAKLAGYLQAAKDKGWLSAKTVAIFPEYVGTWLIAAGEKPSVYAGRDSVAAMTTLAFSHLPAFGYRLLTAPAVADKTKWALFTVKAERAAADYQAVFGALAKRFGSHLVAGSIVLPEPELIDGRLTVHPGGRLYNLSAVFNAQGEIVPPLVIKVFPIDAERQFIASGRADQLPTFATPVGRLGVLICADAWNPPAYAALQQQGARLLAVPSYSAGDGLWATPWGGYNGSGAPADVLKTDVGGLSEGQAWIKYAMPGRAPAAGIAAGLNVFLRGELWDLGSDGATIRVSGRESGRGEMLQGAVLTNLWLN